MLRKRCIQPTGEKEAFNVEARAHALQALARQPYAERQARGQPEVPKVPEPSLESRP